MNFPSKKPHLFIIEDNKLCKSVISKIVSNSFDYIVKEFYSFEICALLAKETPRIILLDHRLPGINGIDAIPLLKTKWPFAQIIVVTSLIDPASRLKDLEISTIDFVRKSGKLDHDIPAGILRAEQFIRIQSN